jgi:hypothetical protein
VKGTRSICVALTGLTFGSVAAQEAPPSQGIQQNRFAAEIGYGQSDNLLRVIGDGLRSDFRYLGIDAGLLRDQARLRGTLTAEVQLRKYDVTIRDEDDEVIGSVDGTLAVDVVPQRFTWNTEAHLGQGRTDPFLIQGPTNRQQIAVYATGPRLALPLGPQTQLQMGATIAERSFEDSPTLDSVNHGVNLALYRAVGPTGQFGLEFSNQDIEFDVTDDGYEFDRVFIAYLKQLASGSVNLRVGDGVVDIGEESRSTSAMLFDWRREIGTRSRFTMLAARQITEAGELFSVGILGNASGIFDLSNRLATFDTNDARLQDIVLTVDPFQRSSISVGFDLLSTTRILSFAFQASEDRFETDDTFDSDALSFAVRLRQRLNTRWSLELDGNLVRREFLTRDQEDDDVIGRFDVIRDFRGRARLNLRIEHNSRDNFQNPFDENVFVASLIYDFIS